MVLFMTLDAKIFGTIPLKLIIPRAEMILAHSISCFCSCTYLHRIFFDGLELFFFFQNSLSTGYFYFPYLLWLGSLLCYPPQKILLIVEMALY